MQIPCCKTPSFPALFADTVLRIPKLNSLLPSILAATDVHVLDSVQAMFLYFDCSFNKVTGRLGISYQEVYRKFSLYTHILIPLPPPPPTHQCFTVSEV
jgi:hypothetical protein